MEVGAKVEEEEGGLEANWKKKEMRDRPAMNIGKYIYRIPLSYDLLMQSNFVLGITHNIPNHSPAISASTFNLLMDISPQDCSSPFVLIFIQAHSSFLCNAFEWKIINVYGNDFPSSPH
jgi:hypothetical protein